MPIKKRNELLTDLDKDYFNSKINELSRLKLRTKLTLFFLAGTFIFSFWQLKIARDQFLLLNRPFLTATMTSFDLIPTEKGWSFSGKLILQNWGKTAARLQKERLSKGYLKQKLNKLFIEDIWRQLINNRYISKKGEFTKDWKYRKGYADFNITCQNETIKKEVYDTMYYMSERYFFVTDQEPKREQVRTLRVENWGSFPEINTIVPEQESAAYVPLVTGLMGYSTKLICIFVKLKYSDFITKNIYHYVLKMVYLVPLERGILRKPFLIDYAHYHDKDAEKYFEGDKVSIDWEIYKPLVKKYLDEKEW